MFSVREAKIRLHVLQTTLMHLNGSISVAETNQNTGRRGCGSGLFTNKF